jgi:predicted DNA-binding ribbon-helix-helix protein
MLRFRILKRRDWRAALRLEEAFWEVLDEAARADNMKLAEYVKNAFERPHGDAKNQSSVLRVQALEYLSKRRRALEKMAEMQNVLGAALAAPAPCFVLNSARKLLNHNREFHALVASSARIASEGGASSAHLTLDVPVPKLIELLEGNPSNAFVCGYTIRIQASSQQIRGKARVTLAKVANVPLLVGYVLDTRITA